VTVVLDTANVVSTSSSFGAGPFTVNVTCAASDNFLLVVVGSDINPEGIPSAVTYNTVAMTHFSPDAQDGLFKSCSFYYMVNPPTGSALVLSVTEPASVSGIGIAALPMSGVNTGAPVGTGATGSGASAAIAATATGGGANDLYIGGCVVRSATLTTTGTNQTSRVALVPIPSTTDSFGVDSIPGSSAGAFTWTCTSGAWAALAVAIKAASGGGGGGGLGPTYNRRGHRRPLWTG
jgi:hypothetical protein